MKRFSFTAIASILCAATLSCKKSRISYINGKVKDSLYLPVTSTLDRSFGY